MDHPLRKRRTFYADIIYKALCDGESYISTFRQFRYVKLTDYPTEECILKSPWANVHRFKIPRYGGFSEIDLHLNDLSQLYSIKFMFADTYILNLNRPILRLVYGPNAIMTLSDMFSCYKDQPIITEMPNLELEVTVEGNKKDDVTLFLNRTTDSKLYQIKPDTYPLYACKDQTEVNTMLIEKLNELTIMINSGNFTQTELIQTVNKQQRGRNLEKESDEDDFKGKPRSKQERDIYGRTEKEKRDPKNKQYYLGDKDERKYSLYLCLEYTSYELETVYKDKFNDTFYIDISQRSRYVIGFYMYIDDFSDVFESISSISIRINDSNGLEFEFLKTDCFRYGSIIFVSLVKEFKANHKPWLIKDWTEIFEEGEIPNFAKNYLELKVVLDKDGKQTTNKKIIIIPINLNVRMCNKDSMLRLIY